MLKAKMVTKHVSGTEGERKQKMSKGSSVTVVSRFTK